MNLLLLVIATFISIRILYFDKKLMKHQSNRQELPFCLIENINSNLLYIYIQV